MEPLPEPGSISITSSQEDLLLRCPFLNAFPPAASTPSDALFASSSSAASSPSPSHHLHQPILMLSLPDTPVPENPDLPEENPNHPETPRVVSDRNSPPASLVNPPADLSEHGNRPADDPPRDFAALRRKLPAWMRRETLEKDWRGPLLLCLSSHPRESQREGFPADIFDVVKMLAGKRERELEGGDDILEVAEKKLGIRFPPPKWRRPGGHDAQKCDWLRSKRVAFSQAEFYLHQRSPLKIDVLKLAQDKSD